MPTMALPMRFGEHIHISIDRGYPELTKYSYYYDWLDAVTTTQGFETFVDFTSEDGKIYRVYKKVKEKLLTTYLQM